MAYLSDNYEQVFSFVTNYLKTNGKTPEEYFLGEFSELSNLILEKTTSNNPYKTVVSEIFDIDGIMIMKYASNKELSATVIANRERSLRDLLLYLPNNYAIDLQFSDSWMLPVVQEFLYGKEFDSEKRIRGVKRTYQKIGAKGEENAGDISIENATYITSKKDAIIAEFKELNMLKNRIERSKFVVEGPLLVERALKAGQLLDKILFSPEFQKSNKYVEIMELANEKKVPYYVISAGLMGAVTDTRPLPGILASVNTVVRGYNNGQTAAKEAVLILDGVANPDNLGMILRTADASGMDSVVLLSNATHYLNKNVIRGGRGAVGKLPIYVSDDDDLFFQELKERQFQIIAMSARAGSDHFFNLQFQDRVAFVIGNESTGIREEIYPYCEESIRIPMVPGQSSLNVAISAGVVLYEYVKRQYTNPAEI